MGIHLPASALLPLHPKAHAPLLGTHLGQKHDILRTGWAATAADWEWKAGADGGGECVQGATGAGHSAVGHRGRGDLHAQDLQGGVRQALRGRRLQEQPEGGGGGCGDKRERR